ncbi:MULTISPECIES: phage major capsid protein [Mycolicibacterium]|uniref:phage major capsid protein n=1 Tax=Mycolicibacterium TaxID=1866885 RepID=UPI00055B8FF0|nr:MULTISPECIES: phage major capsid protein [Mycolicibacterium]UJL26837.1 phage major capsid protein [Mycolicibacterium vanbaalenii]WND58958.1 phage major capsid protein [Mycolicibacterium vanbaalenii]
MAMQHSSTNDAFSPQDFGALLNTALQSESVALQVSTVVKTDKVSITFPIWDEDPAVNWLTELGTITATDGSTDGVTVTPSKVGGITRLSNELADDSSPEVAELAVRGLVNQISHAIDTAFVGNTTTNGPSGLLSIASTAVDTGSAIANTDPFVEAVFAAKNVGAKLTHWLMAPSTAETVAQIKKASGSNESLISFDARGELSILGLPVLTHPGVDSSTFFWGVPMDRVVTVLRKDAEVTRSKDSGFYNDALDVRAITRVGVGFLHEAAVVRGYDAA